MKRVYIDASVCNVLLFGEEKEAERFSHVVQLFEVINGGEIKAVVSLYTLQELCTYCQRNFPQEIAAEVSRLAVRDLLNNEVELVPLLTRMERLVHGRRFNIRDSTDESHVITAHLRNCEAIIAYDEHFRDTSHIIPYLHPDELLDQWRQAAEAHL